MLVQNNAFPCVSVSGSMSSIKRDVKKKVLPRPESRFVSRDPAHFPSASLQGFCLLILISFSATGGNSIELRERQASVVDGVNHGSIRGSWPMAISGYPRGHNVKWVTRCPRHT